MMPKHFCFTATLILMLVVAPGCKPGASSQPEPVVETPWEPAFTVPEKWRLAGAGEDAILCWTGYWDRDVQLFKTPEKADRWIILKNAKDDVGVKQLEDAGDIIYERRGTRARVIQTLPLSPVTARYVEIRLLEGPRKDQLFVTSHELAIAVQ